MKKPDPINKVHNNDQFSSGLMEQYGKWMGGDCFQNTEMPDIHEAPFDGMDPQSNGAEIEDITKKKKEVKKVTPVGAKETAPKNEEYEVLEREEFELNGEIWILEKRLYAVEGSMETARKNVGASTCWKGYKAKGTKMKGGKSVPNCVKAGDELTHDGEELEEALAEIEAESDTDKHIARLDVQLKNGKIGKYEHEKQVAEISNLSVEDRNNYLGELRTYLSKYTSVEKWRDDLLSVYNKDGDNVWLPTNLSPSKGV